MRIAFLADLHSNDLARQAVLEDLGRRGGTDGTSVPGDLVEIGHASEPAVSPSFHSG